MKKITILGGGESGVGAALLAKAKGFEVFLSDKGNLSDSYKEILTQNNIPFEEDHWKDISIGNVQLKGVKNCARCVITTIDQQTGKQSKEPLKTLARIRQWDNRIYFGKYALVRTIGEVKVGMQVNIQATPT